MTELEALRAFFTEAMLIAFDGSDWDGSDIQDKAVDLGLGRWEKYDADKHSFIETVDSDFLKDSQVLVINEPFKE